MVEIDTSKITKQLELNTNSSKKMSEYISKLVRIIIANLINNVKMVKKITHGSHADTSKISLSDIKNTKDTMKRLTFYSNMKLSMKGGRLNLPMKYFNNEYEDGSYTTDAHNMSVSATSDVIRQGLPTTQYSQTIPDVFQQGGSSGTKKNKLNIQKNILNIVTKDNVKEIIDEMNKKNPKKAIIIDNQSVIKIITDSVNKNLASLIIQYKLKVSNDQLDVTKLKNFVDNDPNFLHLRKVHV